VSGLGACQGLILASGQAVAMKAASTQADGEKVLLAAAAAFRAALGERLLAAYALGSLAHGGFLARS